MKTMPVGILGTGVISRTYVSDIQRFYPELSIQACGNRSLPAAQKLAEEFQIPRVLSPQELLEDPDIQLIINLTPPQCHVALGKEILRAGKHLFSEKPFAPTLREAREMVALAKERGVRVGCAPDTFLGSGLQSLRYYLDGGLIGTPFFVTANLTSAGVETWHPNPAPFYQEGAGPVMDMAPYYLSALVALLGPIESIYALSARPSQTRRVYTGPQAGGQIPVQTDTHYTAVLRLRSGVLVNLNLSFEIYRSHLPLFEIYGDGGTLTYPDPNLGGGTPQVYRKEQFTDVVYQSSPQMLERRDRFYDLPELFPRAKDYSRGIGVLEMAHAIWENRESRVGEGLILHLTEAMEGLIRSGAEGKVYFMTTTCQRPQPLVPGSPLGQV